MSGQVMKPTVEAGDPSWWFAEARAHEGNLPPAPALTGEVVADVAIVGGGFTGMWTALALKQRRPDLSVVLIEAALCGSGVSGKNGGLVHGYWAALPGLNALVGPDAALAAARAGSRAMAGIRAFAEGRDFWLREDGNLRVSTTPAQDAAIRRMVDTARELGVPEEARFLTREDLPPFLQAPFYRNGVFLREGGTLHPGRLVRALRQAVLDAGVSVCENTPMTGLDRATPNRITTPQGQITAREVVLATYAALAPDPEIAPYVTLFSSYALATEPAPDKLAAIGWESGMGVADVRMFVHYFRRLNDGRFVLGTGGGPLAYGGNGKAPQFTRHDFSVARIEAALKRLVPALADVPVARAWGGPIDISSDRFPMFKTFAGTRVHYGCGYSGHGINPTWIGGQCLASLVLGQKDEWTSLPFCTRTLPRLPPEPFRYLGGKAIRAAILSCEDAEDQGRRGSLLARATATIPKLFGLRIGTR